MIRAAKFPSLIVPSQPSSAPSAPFARPPWAGAVPASPNFSGFSATPSRNSIPTAPFSASSPRSPISATSKTPSAPSTSSPPNSSNSRTKSAAASAVNFTTAWRKPFSPSISASPSSGNPPSLSTPLPIALSKKPANSSLFLSPPILLCSTTSASSPPSRNTSTVSANAAASKPLSSSSPVFAVFRRSQKPRSSASLRKVSPTSSAIPAASAPRSPSARIRTASPSKSPTSAAACPFLPMARPTAASRASASAFPACASAWPSSAALSKSIPAPPAPRSAPEFFSAPRFSRIRPMTPLFILIADDHAVVRAGLRALLESRTRWQVCAEAADGRDAVVKATKHKPHIAILDTGLPLLNGVEATRQIRKASPATEILILTMHESDDLVQQVIEAGARGYILKDEADRVLLDAVQALSQHKPYFSVRVSEAAVISDSSDSAKSSRSRLTPREREILQLLAEGKSNKEAANLPNISVNTAEAHRANIMLKLDFHSLAELVMYAIRNNIIRT